MDKHKMTILITAKKQEPPTSLQEKQNAFKFKTPTLQTETKVDDKPIPEVDERTNTTTASTTTNGKRGEGVVDSSANKPNANKLLIGKPKPKSLLPVKSAPKTNPIPEMSLDKYEVVIDSVAEFSEATGNKFQEQLAMLQQAIDGTGELKDQMTNILTFLDDNPQYKENVSPQDVSVFVAACRKVAGITVQEKQTRATSKTKVSAKVEEVMGDLADLEFIL